MFVTDRAAMKYRTLSHQIRETGNKPPCEARPELFFAEGFEYAQKITQMLAKSVCEQCPFAAACLDYALEAREEYGIWAGTTPEERKELLKNRRPIR
jgi:WhiB family redox-sensing transcriptional regulator